LRDVPPELIPEEAIEDFTAVMVDMTPETAPSSLIEKPDRKAKQDPKSGIPTLDEWQDFIGRFVLRGVTEGYLNLVLADFYDDLTPRERAMIALTKDDLKEMSAPLASLANKSKFMRTKGRSIIASADSAESVIALLMWMRRVNRIAKKYRKNSTPRPAQGQTIPGYIMEEPNNGNNGQNAQQGPEFGGPGSFGVWNPGTG